MSKVMHFSNTTDRLNFLRGKHTEIKPKEVKPEKKAEEKPKKKKKAQKKEETKDEVQAD